jgi:glycosyltransferase involved in cell wall biosynthesis
MLGAAPETRSSIAAVIDAYRAHGLFKRWPIEYLASHSDRTPLEQVKMTLSALWRLVSTIARYRRVALHVHTAARASFWRDCLFMGVALAARRPLIVQLHGGGFEQFYDSAGSGARALIRFFLQRAACVLVPSESLRVWARGVAREARISSVPNPVPGPRETADPRHPNLVLFLGRMEATKGIFDLLQSVAALRAALPDVRLVCAGDGDRHAVARYAERLGIADAVKFTGWVGPSGKRALLESAAVFVLPSYSEGLPMSLLEAMAAGVPVIASPVGGIPEVVVDGVSGYLVAPGDIATLHRLLRKLLIDRNLAARIGAAGAESARLRFAPERALPRLEEIYFRIGLFATGDLPPMPNVDLKKAA